MRRWRRPCTRSARRSIRCSPSSTRSGRTRRRHACWLRHSGWTCSRRWASMSTGCVVGAALAAGAQCRPSPNAAEQDIVARLRTDSCRCRGRRRVRTRCAPCRQSCALCSLQLPRALGVRVIRVRLARSRQRMDRWRHRRTAAAYLVIGAVADACVRCAIVHKAAKCGDHRGMRGAWRLDPRRRRQALLWQALKPVARRLRQSAG